MARLWNRKPSLLTAAGDFLRHWSRRVQGEGGAPRGAPQASGADHDFLEPDSSFFSTAHTEYFATIRTASDGDLWPSCWADDDQLYTVNGDGRGFGTERWADIVVNRISGTPDTGISGSRLAAGAAVARVYSDPTRYNRKPTGMLAVDGNGDGRDELYLAVQDLRYGPRAFDDAPNASICVSTDYGQTWSSTAAPMFADYMFTTIMFLDFGRSQRHARVLGADDAGYAYAYGLDNNWRSSHSRTVDSPTSLYLARVPTGEIQHRQAWRFFTGTGSGGAPRWSADIGECAPVLHEPRSIYPALLHPGGPADLSVLSQGGVVYNPGLRRYLYTSWTAYTFQFYEAPEPWGPWRLFLTKDFGGYPWFGSSEDAAAPGPKNGGYAATLPSKFISADGRNLWLQTNWFVGVGSGAPNYNFSLRPVHLQPAQPSEPSNSPDATANLASGEEVVPIEKSAHYGHGAYYNDDDLTRSEDSWDNSRKAVDFWGYQLGRLYRLNRVVYTTGEMFPAGGWFDRGLTVQVRQNFAWVTVTELSCTPAYPYNNTAGPYGTYTLRFADTWGDAVRIIGTPGGPAHFTSIAELEVYYDPPVASAPSGS